MFLEGCRTALWLPPQSPPNGLAVIVEEAGERCYELYVHGQSATGLGRETVVDMEPGNRKRETGSKDAEVAQRQCASARWMFVFG